jgi:hypothetical protein
MNANDGWQWVAGLSAFGFYFFLAVWVTARIWSRTKERLAIQETLQKAIHGGAQLTPEIIDSLRRSTPKLSPAEAHSRCKKFRYWGYFLVGLGAALALLGLGYTDSPVKDLRDMTSSAIMFFLLPGLFCLAYSVITSLTSKD